MASTGLIITFIGSHPIWTFVLAILVVLLLFIVYLWIRPIDHTPRVANPNPAESFDEAIARFNLIIEEERKNQGLNPVCHSKLLSHGQATDIVFVMYHGVTNCPNQFLMLGQQFHDRGFNVLIPRIPQHGYADRDISHLANLKVEELTLFADQTIDIARGLGKRVVLIGLSGGGTIVSWAAQTRTDIEAIVLLNPFFSVFQAPAWLSKPVTNLALLIPNMNFYSKEFGKPAIGNGYMGISTRGEVQLMRMGAAVFGMAKKRPPFVHKIAVEILENDRTVNNTKTRHLLKRWQKYPEITSNFYMIGKEHMLPHDIISPLHKKQQIDYVYPIIIGLTFSMLR